MTPAPAMDYGELVERLREMAEHGGAPSRLATMRAAADAIEALKAIVSAREDMDVQHAEVIDQQRERIAALEQEKDQAVKLAEFARSDQQRHIDNAVLFLEQRDSACAALRMVEWVNHTMLDEPTCAWCGFREKVGHSCDCPRQLALSSATREGEK